MTDRTVAIIGGGPAGLAAARLIKLRLPDAAVTVYERAESTTGTFGFGVGLTEATMRNVAAADPEMAEQLRKASHAGHTLALRTGARDVELHGARNLAIGRAAMLEVLTRLSEEVGVDFRMGTKVDPSELTADVIVAADGAGSATRKGLDEQLGVNIDYGSLRYMWCGVDFAVENASFWWRSNGDDLFVAHAYPYAEDRSTILIEADETTWSSAGLSEFDRAVRPGESDRRSLKLVEQMFSDELRGRPLLANRTRWSRFPAVSLQRWYTDNVVLIGDAAHTAHYTIGSGTKLALEDAIALADALAENADVTEAFADYEARRRPNVDRFKHLAARSQAWWTTFRKRMADRPEEIALSYMTRAGNIGVSDYAREYPCNARIALNHLGEAPVGNPEKIDDWVLSRPLSTGVLTTSSRIISKADLPTQGVQRLRWTSTAGEEQEVGTLCSPQEQIVVLEGDADPRSVGARIDTAERIRWEGRHVVVVEVPVELHSMAAAAVATGRVDAVIMAQ